MRDAPYIVICEIERHLGALPGAVLQPSDTQRIIRTIQETFPRLQLPDAEVKDWVRGCAKQSKDWCEMLRRVPFYVPAERKTRRYSKKPQTARPLTADKTGARKRTQTLQQQRRQALRKAILAQLRRTPDASEEIARRKRQAGERHAPDWGGTSNTFVSHPAAETRRHGPWGDAEPSERPSGS